MNFFIRPAFALPLLLLFAPAIGPLAQDSADAGEPTGKMTGRILTADGKTAFEGARVLAYHLSSEKLYRSEPTEGKAKYEITGLPYGYYDVAVETPRGLFVGEQVVNLAPATRAVVTLTLTPTEELPEPARSALRTYPGSEAEPAGLAWLDQKPLGREFWRSPKGVAVLAGGGGAILLAIASGSESSASPFIP